MHVVGHFCSVAVLGVDVDRSENAETVILIKHTSDCRATGVGMQAHRLWRGEMLVDRYISGYHLEFPKCRLCRLGPFPLVW